MRRHRIPKASRRATARAAARAVAAEIRNLRRLAREPLVPIRLPTKAAPSPTSTARRYRQESRRRSPQPPSAPVRRTRSRARATAKSSSRPTIKRPRTTRKSRRAIPRRTPPTARTSPAAASRALQSSQQAGNQGTGLPAGGSQPGDSGKPPVPPPHEPEGQPDAANPEFSKKQVDLALEHLKDEKAKQKSELLDRLGWTKEEAQKFLENMKKLKDSAQQPGSEGGPARRPTTSS